MQALLSLRAVRPALNPFLCRARCLSSSSAPAPTPWFVDQDGPVPESFAFRSNPPHLMKKPTPAPPVPDDAPDDAPAPLKLLHSQLLDSPHLDTSTLVLCRPVPPPTGPPLPLRAPHGKRKRGGTYGGESAYEYTGGIWSWVVMAQVKEGTENRGAIESVVRVVRKVLLSTEPPLTLPPKSRKQMASGWAMIDGGNFAVHVMSKEAREKYFSEERRSEW